MVRCHRKCAIYTSCGLFLALSALAAAGYFGECVKLNEDKESACGKIDEQMCFVCTSCTCNYGNRTNICPDQVVHDYCGDTCRDAKKDIEDLSCLDKGPSIFLLIIFLLVATGITVPTIFYFLKEAFQEITGTQDPEDKV